MDAYIPEKRRWLIEFGLASLIPLIVVGIVLSSALKGTVRQHEISSARQDAEVVTFVAVQNVIGEADDLSHGLTGPQLAAVDRALSPAQGGTMNESDVLRHRDCSIFYD